MWKSLITFIIGSFKCGLEKKERDEEGDNGAELLEAARKGRANLAIRILEKDPDLIRIKDLGGDTAFHVAARAGHKNTMKRLLEFAERHGFMKEVLLEKNVSHGDTPLHVAVKNRHREIMRQLAKAEPKARSVRNTNSMSPWDLAKVAGYDKLMNSRSYRRLTCCSWVRKEGSITYLYWCLCLTTVYSQLGVGSDIEMKIARKGFRDFKLEEEDHDDDDDESFRLFKAVARGQLSSMSQILVSSPTLIRHRDEEGHTVLHIAARAGQEDTLRDLIMAAFPHDLMLERNKDGDTALHLTLKGGHKAAALVLIQAEAAVAYQVNQEGVSPLHLAIELGYQDLVKSLFQEMPPSALPPSTTQLLLANKKTSLPHAAIKAGNLGILQIILEELPNLVDSSDEKGWKPLSYAAYKGHLDQVCYFLEKFPDSVTKYDSDGSLPIHKAVAAGNVSIVKAFLSLCPQTLYCVDKKQRNILHIAVRYAKADVISYLTNEPEVEKIYKFKDHEGKTFMDLAKELKALYGRSSTTGRL